MGIMYADRNAVVKVLMDEYELTEEQARGCFDNPNVPLKLLRNIKWEVSHVVTDDSEWFEARASLSVGSSNISLAGSLALLLVSIAIEYNVCEVRCPCCDEFFVYARERDLISDTEDQSITRPTHVYFIQNDETRAIKIGWSGDVLLRLKVLQREQQAPLTLLGVISGDFHAEKALHNQFAPYRIQGEWFKPVEALMDYISANAVSLDSLLTHGAGNEAADNAS